MHALTILGAMFFIATGCATTPTRYRNMVHPEYGQTEFDRDWYECRRENTRPKVSSVVVPNIGTYDAGMVVDEEMARSCFAARGWRPVAAGSPPPSPRPAAQPTTAAKRSTDPPCNPNEYFNSASARCERIGGSSPASTPAGPAPDEKARTERVQRFAREQLAKPYTQAPFACDEGGWHSVKNYIVDMAAWVEAAGLRKGDRLLSFGEISLAQYDTATEAWSKLPRADDVIVRVDRGGKELSVKLPCRDSSQSRQAAITTLRAIADGQWQACIDGMREYARITRVTSATMLRVALECMRERSKAAGQRLPDEYWRALHAWGTKAIEESHYRPTGLTEIRSALLDAADGLAKAGWPTLADDLKRQISTFGETSSKP